jgi:hypothetical protein
MYMKLYTSMHISSSYILLSTHGPQVNFNSLQKVKHMKDIYSLNTLIMSELPYKLRSRMCACVEDFVYTY